MCLQVSHRGRSSVDVDIVECDMLEVAASEINPLAAQAFAVYPRTGAVQHGHIDPLREVEIEAVPDALPELASAEAAVLEGGLGEGAAGEDALTDRETVEVACAEMAGCKCAASPAGLFECDRGKAAAGESGGGNLHQVQVQAGVSAAIKAALTRQSECGIHQE